MVMRHDRAGCELCRHAKAEGWWGVTGLTHCSDCGRSWTALGEAHCAGCHLHFSTNGNADRHDSKAGCLSRRSIRRRGLVPTNSKWGVVWKRPPPPAELAR